MHLIQKRTKNLNIKNEHGMTPLHNACLRNGEGVVLFLLCNGANPNIVNNQNETPLHIACSAGKLRVIQLLIDFGSSLNAKGPDGTPIETAKLSGHHEVVEFLRVLKAKKKKKMSKQSSSSSNSSKISDSKSPRFTLERSNSQPSNDVVLRQSNSLQDESLLSKIKDNSNNFEEKETEIKKDVESAPSKIPKPRRLIISRSVEFRNLLSRFESLDLSGTFQNDDFTQSENKSESSESEPINNIETESDPETSSHNETPEPIEKRERRSTIDISPPRRVVKNIPRRKRNSSDGSRRKPRRLETNDIFSIKEIDDSKIPKPTIKIRKVFKKNAAPFSKLIQDIDIESILQSKMFVSQRNLVSPRKDDLIAYADGWIIQKGDIQGSNPNLFIEDTEITTFHYKDNFFDDNANPLPQYHFIGYLMPIKHIDYEPIVISILPREGPYYGIIRTSQEDTTFSVDLGENKKSNYTSKKLLKVLQDLNADIKRSQLTPCKDSLLIQDLLEFEKTEKNQFRKINNHKVGILYIKEGQVTEEEMFGNEKGSERFEEFLRFLGDIVKLQGWERFNGGLDTKKNKSGEYSVVAQWLNFEIMFHVSTYMPLLSGEEKYVERKKHIGNDMTCIVFLDGKSKFDPQAIASSFLHVFIVVQPLENSMYKVSVTSKEGVPEFGPPLPSPPVFTLGEVFRDFLLSKIINAERATVNGPWFRSKRQYTRKALLDIIVEKHKSHKH